MSSKKLKAYVVREDSEGSCAIVFETNGAAARRNGGNELNLLFEEVESCRREPAFDQYAPGPVPLRATLAAGWWHECCGCGARFDQDERNYGDDEDREDVFEPVQDAQRNNYCSPACMMGHWAEQRDRAARQVAAIEAALTRWPMASGVMAHDCSKEWPHRGTEMRAQFTLPGIRYPVSWTPGAKTASVSQCDAEEFSRLYGKKDGEHG